MSDLTSYYSVAEQAELDGLWCGTLRAHRSVTSECLTHIILGPVFDQSCHRKGHCSQATVQLTQLLFSEFYESFSSKSSAHTAGEHPFLFASPYGITTAEHRGIFMFASEEMSSFGVVVFFIYFCWAFKASQI